jgi:hypothetical protein
MAKTSHNTKHAVKGGKDLRQFSVASSQRLINWAIPSRMRGSWAPSIIWIETNKYMMQVKQEMTQGLSETKLTF